MYDLFRRHGTPLQLNRHRFWIQVARSGSRQGACCVDVQGSYQTQQSVNPI